LNKEKKDTVKKNTKGAKKKYSMWQNVGWLLVLAFKEKEKKVVFLGLLLAIVVVINNLVNLYVSPSILSVVESGVSVSKLITTILIFTFAMMLCSAVLAYLNTNVLFGRITLRTVMINYLGNKAMTTSYPNVNNDEFNKLISKCRTVTGDNSQATEAIWTTLVILLHDSICFIIWFLLLSHISPVMMAVILVTTIIGYFISNYVNGYEYRHREELAEYENEMWYINNCAGNYIAAKDIRIFHMNIWLKELQEKAVNSYIAFHKKAENIYMLARITDLILAFLRNGIAYLYLIQLVLSKGLSASQFLLYFSAIEGFTIWICGILRSLNELHRQSLDISTVRECLEYPESFQFEEGEKLTPEYHKTYEIRLENVSFSYPDTDENVLSNINLTLHSGEKLAIVGVNGAGKTTLIRLLCGMYDPTEGRVLLNGKDIREYNRRDYYTMFSVVFQGFSILAGSIAVNIAQTEENINMQKVIDCTKKAGLDKKIASLPKAYDTLLERNVYEEAIELSGGEMQRLMLARALYKDAPIVILDEPTAALDPIAESKLYQKYNELTEGKSAVYISHRLASTRFCDRIILLEDHKIMEEGTHEELLKQNGHYAELFMVQSKYYKEGETKEYEEERKEIGFMERSL